MCVSQDGGGSHLGFMQITGVAHRYHSGKQAEFILEVKMSTNQKKNFIGKNVSRFTKFPIEYTGDVRLILPRDFRL